MGDEDRFELYDLEVRVIAGERPMVCDHREGETFQVIGEMITVRGFRRADSYEIKELVG